MSTKHLYIHAPLCSTICTFCDFKRELACNYDARAVINYLVSCLKKFKPKQFKTIYIGGGTPNVFNNQDLDYFLSNIAPLLSEQYEFTIECNPDLITEEQAKILRANRVNRISLGVQSTNNKILKILNRTHTIEDCVRVIKILKTNGFKNISVDFMYALPLMKNEDVVNAIKFAYDNQVQHVSFYGLDLKPGSILTKQKYQIDPEKEADQLETAISEFAKIKFERYEVSNWALTKAYRSQHNLAYWLTKDWAAVGYGAHGLENQIAYEYTDNILKPKKVSYKLSQEEYYQQVLLMGLRLVDGVNINEQPYQSAYEFYKDKLKHVSVKNGYLKCDNVNLLNNTLIDIIG